MVVGKSDVVGGGEWRLGDGGLGVAMGWRERAQDVAL